MMNQIHDSCNGNAFSLIQVMNHSSNLSSMKQKFLTIYFCTIIRMKMTYRIENNDDNNENLCDINWYGFCLYGYNPTDADTCKNSPYILYKSFIDRIPTRNLGCCSFSGYSVGGFKRCETSGLLDCSMDGCYDFFSYI